MQLPVLRVLEKILFCVAKEITGAMELTHCCFCLISSAGILYLLTLSYSNDAEFKFRSEHNMVLWSHEECM